MRGRTNVVCVGAGWVTANRHIPAFQRDPRARVLGVVDTHPDRARILAARYRLPHWGTDITEPWVGDADCASVGTPPATHAEITQALLERDLHVLCEKPMATSVKDAEAMVAAAERRGRMLGVVHNFQFSTAMTRARTLLERGQLGDLTAVYAFQLSNRNRRLPHWHSTLPGGLFHDEAAHLLYLLRSLLGELHTGTVAVRLDQSSAPAQIQQLNAHFEHPSVWAQLTMNFDSSLSEWQFTLVARAEERELARSRFNLTHEKPVVLFIGRLVERKGVDLVIEVSRRLPAVHFLLVGDGPMAATIPDAPNVTWRRSVRPDEVHWCYYAADGFLLPSYGEGLPLVVQEAMACGLPVVAAAGERYAGPLVDEGVCSVAPRTADALTEAVRAIVEQQPSEDRRRQVRRYAETHWSISAMAERYLTLLKEVTIQRGANADARAN